MTQIKKITDKQGNDIYLRTHTKAVVDDNGYTVESRLQATEDIVNQAQLEVGAVPNDLTPIEGSTNWVTSGGLYNQLNVGDANVDIDLTQYTAVRAYPDPNKWLVTNDNFPYYGMFIPIEPNLKYRIKANGVGNSIYAFLTTDSHSQGASVSYATGCTRTIIPVGTESIDTAPNDAHYLWVATYTTTDRTPQKVEVYNKKSIAEILENSDTTPIKNSENLITSGGVYDVQTNAEKLNTSYYKEIPLDDYLKGREILWYINYTNNYWSYSTATKSFFVPIKPNTKYRLVMGNQGGRYAILKTDTAPVSKATPDYASGEDKIHSLSPYVVAEFITPEDAHWLNINSTISNTSIMPEKLEEYTNLGEIVEKVETMDLTPISMNIFAFHYIIDARVSSSTFGKVIAATNDGWGYTSYIDLLGAKYVKYYANTISTSNNYAGVTGTVYYDENYEPLVEGVRLIEYGSAYKAEWITEEIPSGARYMRIGLGTGNTGFKIYRFKLLAEDIYGLQEKIDEIDEKANKEEYDILRNSRYSADGATSGTVGFLHFSDIHGDEGAAQAIKAYYDKYSSYINNMLSTGDVVYYYAADGIDFYTQNGLTDALMALGNHDGASQTGSNVQGSADWDAMGAQWDYETYYAPYISGWGVTQPTDAATNYLMYYYKDYATPKVRLIVLDVMHQTAEQLQWFTDTLADAVTNDYTVVVASHYIPNTFVETNVVKKSDGDKTSFHWLGSNEVTSIDNRFKLATTYADAVETFIANGGKFAVWLCGHYHTDYLTYCNTHPNILFCAINQAGYRRGGGQGYRVIGDHCANMVTIHPALGLIKIHRIGLTTDKYLRPINVLVYDYVNKKVISNY